MTADGQTTSSHYITLYLCCVTFHETLLLSLSPLGRSQLLQRHLQSSSIHPVFGVHGPHATGIVLVRHVIQRVDGLLGLAGAQYLVHFDRLARGPSRKGTSTV